MNLNIFKLYRKYIGIYRYFNIDGSPKRCPNCGSDDINHKTVDSIDYVVCEITCECNRCKANIGYWAYGYYDPEYMKDYLGY